MKFLQTWLGFEQLWLRKWMTETFYLIATTPHYTSVTMATLHCAAFPDQTAVWTILEYLKALQLLETVSDEFLELLLNQTN